MPKLSKEEEILRVKSMWTRENELIKSGYKLICGVDEAGRGPRAGPGRAAAVILPEGEIIEGINDSKKLTPKRREELYDIICEKAVAWASASANEKVIDDINILNATFLAMKNAVEKLSRKPSFVLVDGNRLPDISIPSEAVVKGDSKSINIAAASIIAKVERDRYITEMAKLYPEYGFDKHKGYGTKAHTDAILKYGPSPIHRKTFLKNILSDKGGV